MHRPTRPSLARISAFAALALASVGCVTTAPTLGLARSLYPGTADLDDAQIDRALDTRVRLPRDPSGALVWLELPFGPGEISENERLELQTDLVRALDEDPFGRVDVVPTKRRPLWAWREAEPDLRAMRSAAAHLQADLVLPIETGIAVSPGLTSSGSPLGDLLLLPFLPIAWAVGEPTAHAHASAEICAVDVRTSVILTCARGVGEAPGPALFSGRSSPGLDYRQKAVRKALERAAVELRLGLSRRLATRAYDRGADAERPRPPYSPRERDAAPRRTRRR